LLSPNCMDLEDQQEIIAMSPYTPTDDEEEERTPTPPSFHNNISSIFSSRHSLFVDIKNNTKENIFKILCHDNLKQIISFLPIIERINLCICCKFMNNLVLNACNFDDIWLTFNMNEIYKDGTGQIVICKAKSIRYKRYYRNCINVSIQSIQFMQKEKENNEYNMNFDNIPTRSRSNNKVVRFKQENNSQKSSLSLLKKKSVKRLKDKYLDNLWIWKCIKCLELNGEHRMDHLEWQLLCKYKLSKSIQFLSLDMVNRKILNPDNFSLISQHFPNLLHLKLSNWKFMEKYKECILLFFKLSNWEKSESSLVKLKGIELNKLDENVIELLANNIILCNNYKNQRGLIYESLFTQLMSLNITNCSLSNIAHLQIILNGCINLKYLSLEDITICDHSTMIHKLYEKDHGALCGGGYLSNDEKSKFNDRIQRKKTFKERERNKQKTQKSKHYKMDYLNNVPIIYIPKTVKYLKIYHKFNKNQVYDETFYEAEEDSEYSSNTSTPLMFGMDDLTNSPSISLSKQKQKHFKNTSSMQSKKRIFPLALPPFYCNLAKCHKNLIEANVVINDPHLINQLYLNDMKALKNVILNYDSAEHNRYLNFSEFCAFYPNFFENWRGHKTKHINIILNNSLYDSWRYSVNKIHCTRFLEQTFNKKEHQILKEEHLYLTANQNRFVSPSNSNKNKEKNNLENIFLQKLGKSTDFFQSRTVHHLF